MVNNSGLSISRPLLETTIEDGNMQHDVMTGGSFLVSREAAGMMTTQGVGGDIDDAAVAAAVFRPGGGDLPLTTGLLIPVHAGVAAAFVR